jgi:DNA-binding transcriptional regulator YiaG
MKKKYQSEQLMVCHEEARALYEIGAIDAARMKEFDEMCLASEPTPKTSGVPQHPTPAYTHPRRI